MTDSVEEVYIRYYRNVGENDTIKTELSKEKITRETFFMVYKELIFNYGSDPFFRFSELSTTLHYLGLQRWHVDAKHLK